MEEYTRTVGDRGQVTIPKSLRKAKGIEGGDEVIIIEEDDRIIIDRQVDRDRLAEGYQERAERSRQLAEEMATASTEANEYLDDPPQWDDERADE